MFHSHVKISFSLLTGYEKRSTKIHKKWNMKPFVLISLLSKFKKTTQTIKGESKTVKKYTL